MLKPEQQQMKQLSSAEPEIEQINHLQNEVQVSHTSKYYGKLIIIANKNIHLSLGPDYCFTIVALFFLGGFAYGMYLISYLVDLSTLGLIVHYIFVGLPTFMFLVTALSNPGIYDPEENFSPKRKFCDICKVFIPRQVYHCKYCNICIEEYDHHCPWLSKCVGKKNIIFFNIFLGSVVSSFFYFCYLVYVLVAAQGQKQK